MPDPSPAAPKVDPRVFCTNLYGALAANLVLTRLNPDGQVAQAADGSLLRIPRPSKIPTYADLAKECREATEAVFRAMTPGSSPFSEAH